MTISRRTTVLRRSCLMLWTALSSLSSTRGDNDNDGVVTLPLLTHRHVAERRRRELAATDTSTSTQSLGPLYQGYGTHYVDLWVGTPVPQRQTVIVDTGSQMIAFPCSDCHDCGEKFHTDSYFDKGRSETFETVACDDCVLGHCDGGGGKECKVGLSYQEGSSWRAIESSDVAYAGGSHYQDEEDNNKGESVDPNDADNNNNSNDDNDNPYDLPLTELPRNAAAFSFRMHFGCEDRVTGLFKTQLADGIVGMSNDEASLWKQMKKAGVIENSRFSLCFRRESEADRDGTSAGTVVFGGSEPRLHDTQMVYAENVRSSGFYGVAVRAVYLAAYDDDDDGEEDRLDSSKARVRRLDVDESLLNSGGTIVDSGTTDTYLNRGVAAAFKKEWEAVTGFAFRNDKLKLTDEQLGKLPDILIQIAGHEESNRNAVDESSGETPEDVEGLAAVVDAERPYDVLLTVPPRHYMEYDSETETFFCRVYVDERRGSVVGANTMQSHDVFFDVDGGRIGWAKSDCDFLSLSGKKANDEKREENEFESVRDNDDGVDRDFCVSSSCKFGATAGLVLAALQAVVAWRAFKRRRSSTEPVPVEDQDFAISDEREIL